MYSKWHNRMQGMMRDLQMSQFYTGTSKQLTFVDVCKADSVKSVSNTHIGMRCDPMCIRWFVHTYLRFLKVKMIWFLKLNLINCVWSNCFVFVCGLKHVCWTLKWGPDRVMMAPATYLNTKTQQFLLSFWCLICTQFVVLGIKVSKQDHWQK